MAYLGKDARIKKLKLAIVKAEEAFSLKQQSLKEDSSLENIKAYNDASHELGILNMKLKLAEKFDKPKQYMEEYKIPNHIIL